MAAVLTGALASEALQKKKKKNTALSNYEFRILAIIMQSS
jgi:hypothetical protein